MPVTSFTSLTKGRAQGKELRLPGQHPLPRQGFKIHVSATLSNYMEILNLVLADAQDHGIALKAVVHHDDVLALLSKTTAPEAIGKLVTLYPTSLAEFKATLARLHAKLGERPGAQVVTDQPYLNSQVLWYRYGVFQVPTAENGSGKRPPLLSPAGEEMPACPGPYYWLPDFVDEPFGQELAAKVESVRLKDRYVVTAILKATGAGNVYLARDERTQQDVVIKEARPYIHLNAKKTAQWGLEREAYWLKELSTWQVAPQFVDYFFIDEVAYLVEERLTARPLSQQAEDFLLALPQTTFERQALNQRLLKLWTAGLRLLARLHNEGLGLEDIHLDNWLWDGSHLQVVDWESVYRFDEGLSLPSTHDREGQPLPPAGAARDEKKWAYAFVDLLSEAGGLLAGEPKGQAFRAYIGEYLTSFSLPQSLGKELQDLLALPSDSWLARLPLVREGLTLEKLQDHQQNLARALQFQEASREDLLANWQNAWAEGLAASPLIAKRKAGLGRCDEKQPVQTDLALLANLLVEEEQPPAFPQVASELMERWGVWEGEFFYLKLSSGALSPRFLDGTAGLAYLLASFEEREGQGRYTALLRSLRPTLRLPYSKHLGLAQGLTGLALANTALYRCTQQWEDLKAGLSQLRHVCQCHNSYWGSYRLLDPKTGTPLDTSLAHGLAGVAYSLQALFQATELPAHF